MASDLLDVSLSKFWELVMDREAWRPEIHGVAKSRTRLSDAVQKSRQNKQSDLMNQSNSLVLV